MAKSLILEYLKTIKHDKIKLSDFKKAVGRYKLLGNQFGQDTLNEAIEEIKKEKGKNDLSDLDVFLAYENEIKELVWKKHSFNVSTPNKEIQMGDIDAIAKKFNTTREIAQVIYDFKIMEPHNTVHFARKIIEYNLKDNPNAVEIVRIINNNDLLIGKDNAATLAEIIFKFNLKESPNAITISQFIMDNNLKDNLDALKIYDFILSNKLLDNPNAITLYNMINNYGLSFELANDVCNFNNNNFYFNQYSPKYIFNKLRQIYQAKMRIEPNLNMEQEVQRIMRIVNMDASQAKYFLICCMGKNWGRNSSFYWDYNQFKEDFSNSNQEFTDEEMTFINGYIRRPAVNRFARGFETQDGKAMYNNGQFTLAMNNEEIKENEEQVLPLYNALNKNSLSQDVIVFRGANIGSLSRYNININDSEEEIKRKLGGRYQDGGFMSTSSVIEEKGNFLNCEVNFMVDLKAGTPCGDLSTFSEFDVEREVLIPPNVVFNVSDVRKIDGKIIIYLTSIPTKTATYFDDETKTEGRSR